MLNSVSSAACMCIRCYVHPDVCILRWYVHQETEATPWSCTAGALSDTIECTQTERSHNYANFQHCHRRRKKDPYIPECDVMPASVFAQSHIHEYAYAEVSQELFFAYTFLTYAFVGERRQSLSSYFLISPFRLHFSVCVSTYLYRSLWPYWSRCKYGIKENS